jgi:hypothetical protein
MDHAIPTHPIGRPAPISYGYFLLTEGKVVLMDRRGNSYNLEYVNVGAAWGRAEDGSVKLPRPEVRDPTTDAVIVEGDLVVILFMDGNYSRPIVWGVVRSFAENTATLPYAHDADPADLLANKLRGRLRGNLDETLGDLNPLIEEVRWEVNETPGAATVKVTQYVETAKVLPISAAEFTLRGETFLTDLQTSLTEIIAFAAGLGVPLPSTTILSTNIATSLLAGAPYRSTTMKVE